MNRLFHVAITALVGGMLLLSACKSDEGKTGSGGNPAGTDGRGSGGEAGPGDTGTSVGEVDGGGGSVGSGGNGGGSTGAEIGAGGFAGGWDSSVATGGGDGLDVAAWDGGAPAGGATGVDGEGGGGNAIGSGGFGGGGGGGTSGSEAGGAATGGVLGGASGQDVDAAASGGTSGGASGSGGRSGAGGAMVLAGDDYVSDVKVVVHPNTATILVVTWTQLQPADKTWLEFSFSGGGVMMSRALAGATGSHRDGVLGVPEKTPVTVRIVSKVGNVDYKTKDYQGTTGALPSGLPKAEVLAYDATLASPHRWLLGAVENSPGGCGDPSCYYIGTFWIYIMDRQGRMVWYWADPSDNASSAYPRVARDGEYLVIDKGRQGRTGVVKTTLDRQFYQFLPIAKLDDAIDVTTDGSVLYDVLGDLHEVLKDGRDRLIWTCRTTFPTFENCYSNTINWNQATDSVMLSFPTDGTVVEISRKDGSMVGQYGNAAGSYAFSPTSWKFQYPHSPTITADGTLVLSTHLPAFAFGTPAAPRHHAFAEFTIDRISKTLTEKWVYSDGSEWAMFKGFAVRLPNGNLLGNYGTGGVIREITPDKKTVFQVKFGVTPGDGYNHKMVGNNVFVDDLYALNGGPKG